MTVDRLPEETLTNEFNDILKSTFADEIQPNAERKIPLDDLRNVRKKVYVLRKILEGKVATKLKVVSSNRSSGYTGEMVHSPLASNICPLRSPTTTSKGRGY